MVSKIDQLAEQTEYLLKLQQSASLDCIKELDGLMETIEDHCSSLTNASDIESVEKVREILGRRVNSMKEAFADDVTFLTEQLDAIKKVKTISDKAQRAELEAMLIEDAGEIQDTAEFKKDVAQEAEESKKDLMAVIDDIKNALQEGGIKELEALVVEMEEYQGDDDFDEDEDDDIDLENDDEVDEIFKEFSRPYVHHDELGADESEDDEDDFDEDEDDEDDEDKEA